jgi:hypothetical protein
VWYARDTAWDGVFSTYRYDWASGDRFGFAPVTITEGADLLGLGVLTASGGGGGSGASSGGVMMGKWGWWLLGFWVWVGAVVI